MPGSRLDAGPLAGTSQTPVEQTWSLIPHTREPAPLVLGVGVGPEHTRLLAGGPVARMTGLQGRGLAGWVEGGSGRGAEGAVFLPVGAFVLALEAQLQASESLQSSRPRPGALSTAVPNPQRSLTQPRVIVLETVSILWPRSSQGRAGVLAGMLRAPGPL